MSTRAAVRSSFPTRLAWARGERGMTQDRLALLSGVSQGALCSYEHGREPRLLQLLRVARALGVDPGWLVGEGELGHAPPFPAALVPVAEFTEAELAEWAGDCVATARERCGQSRCALARATGGEVTNATIGRSRRTMASTTAVTAAALGLSLAGLLLVEEEALCR